MGGGGGGWLGLWVAELGLSLSAALAMLIVIAVRHPQVEAVLPMEAEFASPMWIFGQK